MLNRIILAAACLLLPAVAVAQDGRLKRCEPHRAIVESILASEGVNLSFYYLMVAESGCREHAISKAGAFGFWQLMPATARRFGCAFAEDLACETRAAARYIKTLSERFNTFDEVICAYNQGGHNFAKNGATREALGLLKTVKDLIKEDAAHHEIPCDLCNDSRFSELCMTCTE